MITMDNHIYFHRIRGIKESTMKNWLSDIFIHYLTVKKEEKGVIVKITSKGIYVFLNKSCSPKKDCHGCKGCQSTSSLPSFFCPVKNSSEYSQGQHVKVTYTSLNQALAAILLFGIPILCAIVSFVLLYSFNPDVIHSYLAPLTTFVAMGCGFFLVFVIDKCIHVSFPVSVELVL